MKQKRKTKNDVKIELLESKVSSLENFRSFHSHSFYNWTGVFVWAFIIFFIIYYLTNGLFNGSLGCYQDTTYEDYCAENYGSNTWYNNRVGKPYQVRSCDAINEDGEIVSKYFTKNEYKIWKENKVWECENE